MNLRMKFENIFSQCVETYYEYALCKKCKCILKMESFSCQNYQRFLYGPRFVEFLSRKEIKMSRNCLFIVSQNLSEIMISFAKN